MSKDEALKDKGKHGSSVALLLTSFLLPQAADLSCLEATLLPTPAPPLNVSLSCDDLTLSVCLTEHGKLKCLFFDTRILSSKVTGLYTAGPWGGGEGGIPLSKLRCFPPNPSDVDSLCGVVRQGCIEGGGGEEPP